MTGVITSFVGGSYGAAPGAPTIGTATAGSSLCASVTFTAPVCTGSPPGITGYRVISTPGCLTTTGASSPLVVTGLTAATSYTFKAQATNAVGYGPLSAASNSITASSSGSQSYTTSGTYTWVAPSGVTAVSVVAVGAGGSTNGFSNAGGGAGGGVGYKNNYSVTPGNSYTVVVGAAAVQAAGGSSYFVSLCVAQGGGGGRGTCIVAGIGGVYIGDGGGIGGNGGTGSSACGGAGGGGGGAGGYAGNGGKGANARCGTGTTGVSGAGGAAGGGGGATTCSPSGLRVGGGGGGVGLLGQGSNGAGGAGASGSNCYSAQGGSGGSGGANGFSQACGLGAGGAYGGGGGYRSTSPGVGAVRIIWPGNTRSFPSTCAGSP